MSISVSAEEATRQGYVAGLQTGKIEPRLEIDEFALDDDLLNIFLLGLLELQKKDYRDPWSWFQIAGIHGKPYTSWDQVSPKPSNFGNVAGYCSHSSIEFPTWHRPYLAMMEQAVYVEMLKIAKKYTNENAQNKYLEACSRFRFPYWDICLPRQSMSEQGTENLFGVPKIVSSPQVYLKTPENPDTLTMERNPLHNYEFPTELQLPNDELLLWKRRDPNALFDNPNLQGTTHTVRAPDSHGRSDDAYFNEQLSKINIIQLGSSLHTTLTTKQTWDAFSNDVSERKLSSRIGEVRHSIEGFHDNVHNFLGQGKLRGGSGYMSFPQYAAFDPIFWLHHCNIDRITAIWQALQGTSDPASWWKEKTVREASWSVTPGTLQTPADPLEPFRSTSKNAEEAKRWDSNEVRNWSRLGYTYLGYHIVSNSAGKFERNSFPIEIGPQSETQLLPYVNQFYGWTSTGASTYPAVLQQFYPVNLDQCEALTGQEGNGDRSFPKVVDAKPGIELPSNANDIDYEHLPPQVIHEGKMRQWDIHIEVEKFKFNGAYQVFVFLGPFDAHNPEKWPLEQSLIGIDGIFSNNASAGGCANCEQQADAKLRVVDVIPLTPHLIKWIGQGTKCPPDDAEGITCESLEYDQVFKFLRKNLHWRVANANLEVIEDVGDCVILQAVDRIVTLPFSYTDSKKYEEVTVHALLSS